MLQQEMPDLDFDAYFDVTSSSMHPSHQQQIPNYDQALHPGQPHRFGAHPSIAQLQQHQYYLPQQQQQQQQQQYHHHQQNQSFQELNWYLKQQQQPNQQHAPMLHQQHTPVSTPGIDSQPSLPGPDYFCSAQQPQQGRNYSHAYLEQQPSAAIVDTSAVTPNGCFAAPPANAIPSNHATGFPSSMSDVIFPSTPHSRASVHSSELNSPCSTSESSPKTISPASETSPQQLTNAFAAIDQWRKSDNENKAIADSLKEDCHEIRHWRKGNRNDSVSSNTSNMVATAVAAVAARSGTSSRRRFEAGRHLKKVAHNAIERRYRNNINDRIQDLKNVVPALYKAKIREKKSRAGSSSNSNAADDNEDEADEFSDDETTVEIVEGVEVAKKLNKATILHKATEYIHHLKHTNELAERENQVLQQILAQMPGGAKVLSRFQVQKHDLQQAEEQRILAERKELMERERAERQQILRERAAQRAALAELLPKAERRSYRKRAKKEKGINDVENEQQAAVAFASNESQSDSSTTTSTPASTEKNNGGNGNKVFMAMFLCLVIASPLSFDNSDTQPHHGSRTIPFKKHTLLVRSFASSSANWFAYW
ncbi:hypothetical protein [Parasitella parasitica]|uniref:BHLH domain-containing protein n=1 Tax=Parasitella parasitica TaxID=35722 RepID=A0A0B7ND08_9FUNG|nr:hypothetical protein [Parasitella parasitica]